MNQDQTINLNHNAAECIKTISRFGSTTYNNICSGSSVTLDWGSVDWAMCIFLVIFGVSFLALLMSFAFIMIRDF